MYKVRTLTLPGPWGTRSLRTILMYTPLLILLLFLWCVFCCDNWIFVILFYSAEWNREFLFFFCFWDNYSKPTCSMSRFHFTYPWFKTLHFAHLNFNLLPIRYPPHLQTLEKHIFIQNQNITQIKNMNHWIFYSRALETRKPL